MTEPIYQPKTPSPTVTCAHCGAVIDRAQARPIVAQEQVGEVVDMSRRHQCADRERCEARGPIAQTAEQLRADLEAAQTVIEAQRVRIDALVAEEIETRGLVNAHLEELAADRRQLVADLKATRKQRDAARGAQTATATEAQEQLERQARARLVREIEFVRAVRALALDGTGRPNCTINTVLSMTTKAMTAIEQDKAIEHPAEARIRELEAERDELARQADHFNRCVNHLIEITQQRDLPMDEMLEQIHTLIGEHLR